MSFECYETKMIRAENTIFSRRIKRVKTFFLIFYMVGFPPSRYEKLPNPVKTQILFSCYDELLPIFTLSDGAMKYKTTIMTEKSMKTTPNKKSPTVFSLCLMKLKKLIHAKLPPTKSPYKLHSQRTLRARMFMKVFLVRVYGWNLSTD